MCLHVCEQAKDTKHFRIEVVIRYEQKTCANLYYDGQPHIFGCPIPKCAYSQRHRMLRNAFNCFQIVHTSMMRNIVVVTIYGDVISQQRIKLQSRSRIRALSVKHKHFFTHTYTHTPSANLVRRMMLIICLFPLFQGFFSFSIRYTLLISFYKLTFCYVTNENSNDV